MDIIVVQLILELLRKLRILQCAYHLFLFLLNSCTYLLLIFFPFFFAFRKLIFKFLYIQYYYFLPVIKLINTFSQFVASLQTKLVEVMEFQWSYSKSRKMTLWKCTLSISANLENSAAATGLEKVSFHSNPKERQCQRMLKLPHNCTHLTH